MDIYFEISFDEKNTYITLHSKKLRNYDTQIQGGFWEEVLIEDPELIFRNISNNKIFRMKLLNGVIGENLKTPGQSNLINLKTVHITWFLEERL